MVGYVIELAEVRVFGQQRALVQTKLRLLCWYRLACNGN